MERRRIIQFKVMQSQYERILLKKENAGYQNLSQFVRDFLLRDDLVTEKLIREIHEKVVGNTKSENKDEEDEENKIGL